MKRIAQLLPLALAALAPVFVCGTLLRAQEDPTLDAKRRVFPDVGDGFRAIRRGPGPDGSYYVLVAASHATPSKPSNGSKTVSPRAPAVLVFDSKVTKLRQIPAQPRRGEIVSPSALDLDSSGRVDIADQSANSVNVYSRSGTLFAHFVVPEPTHIVALPCHSISVCSTNADRP